MARQKKRKLKKVGSSYHTGFKRSCVNCLKHKHCDLEPPSGIKRFTEWCPYFIPDDKKIKRKSKIWPAGVNPSPKNIYYRLLHNEEKTKEILYKIDEMYNSQ